MWSCLAKKIEKRQYRGKGWNREGRKKRRGGLTSRGIERRKKQTKPHCRYRERERHCEASGAKSISEGEAADGGQNGVSAGREERNNKQRKGKKKLEEGKIKGAALGRGGTPPRSTGANAPVNNVIEIKKAELKRTADTK